MSVTSAALPSSVGRSASHSPARKIVAVIVWMGGAYLTALLIQRLHLASGTLSYALGGIVQIVMTFAESPIWKRRRFTWASVGALSIDLFSNLGGVWLPVQHIDQNESWAALVDAGIAQPSISPLTKLVIAVGVAALVAALPEHLWES